MSRSVRRRTSYRAAQMASFPLIVAALVLNGCSRPAPPLSSARTIDHGERAIIDVHQHSFPAEVGRGTLAAGMAALDSAGVDRVAVHFIRRDMYEAADSVAPGRILRGVSFPCWKDQRGQFFVCDWGESGLPDLAWLRAEAAAGRLTHLGEMAFVYAGLAPDDSRMEPYWALAEEFGLPVMVHVNRGPPGDSPMRRGGCCPRFDADLGNPALYRPILDRYPRLKLVLQHFGFPALPMFDDIGYVEESFALLRDYPTVMIEMSTYHSVPFVSPDMHAELVRRVKREGLLDRLMFATDNWPAGPAIARYDAMDFLTDAEKRAIFHDNAARLFGID